MKNILIYLSFFLLFSLSGIAQGEKEILDDYLRTAAENNPGLKSKFNNYMAAMEKVPQVETLPDPKFAFGYFIQPVETKNGPQEYKISLSQMMPWFGRLKTAKQAQTYKTKAAYESFLQNKNTLFKRVKITYYDLYFIAKNIQVIKENITLCLI